VSRPAGPAGVEAALTAHVGRSRQAESTLGPWPAAALAAALGRDDPPGAGEALPPFWHQLYANAAVAASATGPDGHERRGEFLPPVPSGWLRMWAGGRLRLERPLRIGERISKISTVRAVTPKRGRQGRLVFVLVEHRWEASGGEVVLVEEQDLVYREPVQPAGSVTEIAADGKFMAAGLATRSRPALPLLRVDLQRPPHPLRCRLRTSGVKAIPA
jgi:3-methylfumaryl-CoA hydratase